MRGRNGTFHRYYYCRNHDILRAGGEHLRCPERNIRADELDAYVFAQVRRALLEPAPADRRRASRHHRHPARRRRADRRPARHARAQARPDRARARPAARRLPSRAARPRRAHPPHRRTHRPPRPTRRRARRPHRPPRRARDARTGCAAALAGFAERVLASLDELDFDGRQRLLRMVVEKVRVTGWRVEIHLKIPLTDDDPGTQREPRPPKPDPGPSSDMGLRSVDHHRRPRQLPARPGNRRQRGEAPDLNAALIAP